MKTEKERLRDKIVEFQSTIAELRKAARDRDQLAEEKEKRLYLDLFEIMDAFEVLEKTIDEKADELNKPGRMLSKNFKSVGKKMSRILKTNDIVRIELEDGKAKMEYCKVVDTKPDPDKENETILSVLKNGYMRRERGTVLRKAEVVTVLND